MFIGIALAQKYSSAKGCGNVGCKAVKHIKQLCEIRMTNQPRQKPERKTGISHLFAATGYSISGFSRLLNEAAFRHELLMGLVVFVLFALVGASLAEFMVAVILLLLLIAFEALNTAIEAVVDHISPQWNQFAKDAKDLGSLSVMCLLIANAAFLAYVLIQHLLT